MKPKIKPKIIPPPDTALSLLKDSLTLFNDHRRFYTSEERLNSYDVAARITMFLKQAEEDEKLPPLHGLPIFTMTDQPPTCPSCGRRVDIIKDPISPDLPEVQLCHCKSCDKWFKLEDDKGDTYD